MPSRRFSFARWPRFSARLVNHTMNDKLYDALEICLQALEDGASLDSALARYPDLASELRPILEAARRAREIPAPRPSADAMRRGRAALLQRAAEMREAKRPARKRQPVIPFFQRLVMALTITGVALMSGTGLVQASSTSLPGENLYPVKRTWEDMRLLFVLSPEYREVIESEYEVERLDEVGELLRKGRSETIRFSGLVTEDANGTLLVSGLPVAVTDQTVFSGDALALGTSVIVTGQTDQVGRVTALSVQSLPPGTVVPTGEQEEHASEEHSTFHIEGALQAAQGNVWTIDGQAVYVEDPALLPLAQVGVRVEVRGYFSADGRFVVTRVEIEEAEAEEHNNQPSENGSDVPDENQNTNEDSDQVEDGSDDNQGDDQPENDQNKDTGDGQQNEDEQEDDSD